MLKCFVTGTDTGVGKTVVAAGLTLGLSRLGHARYWKPVQTGALDDDDTREAARLTGLPEAHFAEPVYRFPAPLSPHLAAELAGDRIAPERVLERARAILEAPGPLVVEGAGGLLVPLAPGFLQIDLVRALGIPVLLVAHDKLGAINHTLLSVEACRTRGLPLLGVVLNRAGTLDGNGASIERYGKVTVLDRVPQASHPRETLTRFASLAARLASLSRPASPTDAPAAPIARAEG